jgi:hypothetical protein
MKKLPYPGAYAPTPLFSKEGLLSPLLWNREGVRGMSVTLDQRDVNVSLNTKFRLMGNG